MDRWPTAVARARTNALRAWARSPSRSLRALARSALTVCRCRCKPSARSSMVLSRNADWTRPWSCVGVNGLHRKSSAPVRRLRARSSADDVPLSSRTRKCAPPGPSRSRRRTSSPLRSGRPTSSRTKSYWLAAAASRAAVPVAGLVEFDRRPRQRMPAQAPHARLVVHDQDAGRLLVRRPGRSLRYGRSTTVSPDPPRNGVSARSTACGSG